MNSMSTTHLYYMRNHSKHTNSLEKELVMALSTRIIEIDEGSNVDNILILGKY